MKQQYTHTKLIELISNGGEDQENAIRWIYSKSGWVSIVKKMIRNLGGSNHDAEDIVQDGLINFIMDVQKGKIQKIEGANAYFIRSCKNNWLNNFNRKLKAREIIDREFNKEETSINEEKIFVSKEIWEHLDRLLEQIGRKCKEVLKLWSMGYSHEEIAKLINYENANVSKKTKSLCIEKLKNMGLNPDDWKY